MKKQMLNRLFAVVLAVVFIVSMLPMSAFAAGSSENLGTVSITVLGDTAHSDGEVHTYKDGNLTEWLTQEVDLWDTGLTAKDLIERSLSTEPFSYQMENGGYISEVTYNGITLGQLTNGASAGWLYCVNSVIPDVGIADYVLQDGDAVVLFYTDDFAREFATEVLNTEQTGETTESLPKDSASQETGAEAHTKREAPRRIFALCAVLVGIAAAGAGVFLIVRRKK